MRFAPAGMGAAVPIGLDFGAVMAFAAAQGANLDLVADALPDVERAVIAALAEAMTQEGDVSE